MKTPFEIDSAVVKAAESAGMGTVVRRDVIKIDEALLPPEYWKPTPNYQLIRKHINSGVQIPGAELTGKIEYILTPQETK